MLNYSNKSLVTVADVEFFTFFSVRDDSHWTSRKNSLDLIELASINKVSLV